MCPSGTVQVPGDKEVKDRSPCLQGNQTSQGVRLFTCHHNEFA